MPFDLIALYGAILSTILAIREFQKGRRKVLVTYRLNGVEVGGKVRWNSIEIKAVNRGYRPVEITGVELDIKHHRLGRLKYKEETSPLPKRILDGESVTILLDYSEAEKQLTEISNSKFECSSAVVIDAEGKEYQSGKPEYEAPKLVIG